MWPRRCRASCRRSRRRIANTLAPGTGERPLGRRFVDDSKVTDHHAIIPTTTSPVSASLSADERKIYDLICRRLLSAWHEDHIWSVTTVITAIRNAGIVDRYHTSGSAVAAGGLEGARSSRLPRRSESKDRRRKGRRRSCRPGWQRTSRRTSSTSDAVQEEDTPPKRFTEATLLTAMETAGRTLDEKELSDAMKETGLGTPATRAAIIEVLLKREYIVRERQEPRSDRQGHPADRGRASRGEKPRDDRPVGGVPHAHPPREGAARRLY